MPTTVLSVIARLFEKLIHEQLFPYFNDYLYKNRSGFRPKYSTQTALLNTSNQCLINIDKGECNIAVFLDLRKAIDTVNHNVLLLKLESYGILGIELKPLEPHLFLIYINDLPCALEKSKPDIYADDTRVFVSGRDTRTLEENVNLDLQHICSWLHANKLTLNTLKCKYMIIGSSHNLSYIKYIPNINIQGHSIERVDQFEQLGVTIDDQLKWDKHVDKLCKKLSSALFSMRQVKILPKPSLLTLYRSLVESRLKYCNVIWGNCGISLKNKLHHLQNHAVELINSDSELVNLNTSFKELSLLNVQQLIDYSTTTLVYDSVHGNCPEYVADLFIPASNIHNYQTRHAHNGLFELT